MAALKKKGEVGGGVKRKGSMSWSVGKVLTFQA